MFSVFRTKPLFLIIAVAVVLILALWWGLSASRPVNEQSAQPPAPQPAATPTPEPSAKKVPPVPAPGAAPERIPPFPIKTSITIIDPGVTTGTDLCAGTKTSPSKWVSGENNTIRWSKETGITGAIYLANASDNSLVGWITQSTNVHQTYYSWNTRDLFLSRTSPLKKTVQAGQYVVKAVFDGGSPKFEITSIPFSIIYPGEMPICTYTLTIKNYAVSPSTLTVRQGSKLIFVNNDSVTHKIVLSSYPTIVLDPGNSATFDTSSLFPGTYAFYSETYSTLRTTVTVQ